MADPEASNLIIETQHYDVENVQCGQRLRLLAHKAAVLKKALRPDEKSHTFNLNGTGEVTVGFGLNGQITVLKQANEDGDEVLYTIEPDTRFAFEVKNKHGAVTTSWEKPANEPLQGDEVFYANEPLLLLVRCASQAASGQTT